MKTATIHQLKKELVAHDKTKIIDLCMRLARFKKDNKELLTYLLFESSDEESFIASLKTETDRLFSEMNRSSIYLTKKTLRKILRYLDKNIRYSGNKETEAELRIFLCRKIVTEHIPIDRYKVLTNIYERQIIKIEKALSTLHEDLQFDYEDDLEELKSILD
jgi:hypothetical protein